MPVRAAVVSQYMAAFVVILDTVSGMWLALVSENRS